jgi:diphosphomevalonate decarboxylase
VSERVATAEAASNIALVKYWGALDLERAVPVNPSISMTLSSCRSICRATFDSGSRAGDEILLEREGVLEPAPPAFADRIARQLVRLRSWAGVEGQLRIATRNTFPAAAGIASSASGFAALTLAVVASLDREVSVAEMSTLARLSGSGSAARSVLGGFVVWPAPGAGAECYAECIADAAHWPLCDLIAIVQSTEKEVSSLDGHIRAATSPHFSRRLELLPGRLDLVRQSIATRDLELLGPVLEEEAIELHLVAMSSHPPIYYWLPATLAVLAAVRRLRQAGYSAWCTMDAGANVHVLCRPEEAAPVAAALREVPGVERVIEDRVGGDPIVCAGDHF